MNEARHGLSRYTRDELVAIIDYLLSHGGAFVRERYDDAIYTVRCNSLRAQMDDYAQIANSAREMAAKLMADEGARSEKKTSDQIMRYMRQAHEADLKWRRCSGQLNKLTSTAKL